MASLKDLVHQVAPTIRDGAAWIIVYRSGRSWNSHTIRLDEHSDAIDAESMKVLQEILAQDPRAVAINGNYASSSDNAIVDTIRSCYECGSNLLINFLEFYGPRSPEAIEADREIAHAAGLPFSERWAKPGQEPDCYAYDGSMTPEDYELMQQIRARGDIAEVIEKHFPDVTPDQINELTEKVAECRRISAETLDNLLVGFKKLLEALSNCIRNVISSINGLYDASLNAACENPKHWHFYKHAKRLRTRKKYLHRLQRSLAKAMVDDA